MPEFVLNNNMQPNGDYEVHNKSAGCLWMPRPENRTHLGQFNDCQTAVLAAKLRRFSDSINGCRFCCPDCHTS